MKYRYFITNTFDGEIEATNDEQKANDYSMSEDFYVVDALNAKQIVEGEPHDVKNLD